MLERISWLTYLVSILAGTLIYYSWVFFTFYRRETAGFLAPERVGPVPAHPRPVSPLSVIGPAAPDEEMVVSGEELSFGPPDADELPDQPPAITSAPAEVSEFAEMVAEIKTLIRVMSESSESRENFDLLFGLIIQKYPALTGTPYRGKIIGFLLAESKGIFPFHLQEKELEQIWDEQFKY